MEAPTLTSNQQVALHRIQVRPILPTERDLMGLARGHWGIENSNHHVSDTTFHENLSQVRTENGPRMMATLRELAMSIMRLTGDKNIAKAARNFASSAWVTLRQFGF